MDPENNEQKRQEQKQDEQELGGLKKGMKNVAKNAKNKFSMIFRRILAALITPLVIKIVLVVAFIGVIVAAFTSLLDFFGSSSIANVASMNILQNEVSITAGNNDEGYYFKINQDIVDKYTEELFNADQDGYYDNVEIPDGDEEETNNISEEENTTDREEYDEDAKEATRESIKEWFEVEDFDEYLVRMLSAEIASSYPKLGDYTGDEEDSQGNKKDANGDYVVQGVVKIHRQMMNQDGTVGEEFEMTYLPHEQLTALITANDRSALNYFSFDENTGLVYYATYKEIIVYVNGIEVSRILTLQENNVSYTNLTEMCSMPYNFLFALLQTSENPDYVMAVIDMLMEETDIVLMIQDQLNTTILTERYFQVEKTTSQTLTADSYTTGSGNEIETHYYWTYGGIEESYSFPAGAETRVETFTYTNTSNVYIKKAYTWCLDFEQGATLNSVITPGIEQLEDHSEGEMAGMDYNTMTSSNRGGIPSPSEGASYTIIETFLSDGNLLYSTKLDTEDYTWNVSISTEKRINYERFLGRWKNDTGEYYIGTQYKEDGIEVEYLIPEEETAKEAVVNNIADPTGQNIDDLVDLLSMYENTQNHEQILKYYWNVYYGEDIYDVNIDELLDLFDTETFTSLSDNSSLYGSSVEEKLWYALIDAGYSEYAAAGAMGNIWRESGFITNNVQNSYENSLGMGDAEYTAAVDDGTYTEFATDSVGYGLCQWTTSNRKEGLLKYVQSKGTSISNGNAQIEYLLGELDSSKSSAASAYATYQLSPRNGYTADDWINAESVEDATRAFCWLFERPAEGDSAAIDERITKAQEIYEKYHGKTRPDYTGVDSYSDGRHTYPHYLQNNYSGSYGSSTIAKSGCGPTSLAMVLAGYLDDPSITPTTVVENIKAYWPDGSYYQAGTGSMDVIYSSGFLQRYYGVTSVMYPSESEALAALDQGYPVIGREEGHILAIVPVSEELKAQGYKFYILDSARGHDGPYKSVAEANEVVRGSLSFKAIIK